MEEPATMRVVYDLVDAENEMRLKCIDGEEIPDWKTRGMLMADHLREMAAAGWTPLHVSGKVYVYRRSR